MLFLLVSMDKSVWCNCIHVGYKVLTLRKLKWKLDSRTDQTWKGCLSKSRSVRIKELMWIVSKSRSNDNLEMILIHFFILCFYKQVLLSTYCLLSSGLDTLRIISNWGMDLDLSSSQSSLYNRSKMPSPQGF